MTRKGKRVFSFTFILVASLVVVGSLGCVIAWLVLNRPSASVGAGGVELEIAYSPEKEELFQDLMAGFEKSRPRTPQGQRITVRYHAMTPDRMASAVLDGEFDVVSPDSSIWLSQLDAEWRDHTGRESAIVGETVRYAVSPVVIAMWEDTARSMGYPDAELGWQTILAKASEDPDFHWSHPSTSSASGLLATLAEFYAGAGKTRGLTKEDVLAESTLAYVQALENTVRYYGEGELAVIERALREGRGDLDAFVAQEQMVVYFNENSSDRLVAVYPVEGTLWADHPLALLERPEMGPELRQGFEALRNYVTGHDAQMIVLRHGYRPTDLSISLDDPASPIGPQNGVDPSEPQTALQIPGLSTIEVVRDAWWYTKRHTNVYLVVDTSGSMQGRKLSDAQDALRVFVDQIRGENERVGLIRFDSNVEELIPLAELQVNRTDLETGISRLTAEGDTAMLDAVDSAYTRLQALGDQERINAIVVMTDGKENASRVSLSRLVRKLNSGNQSGVPVVVFCIAYGRDADYDTMEKIAEATGGQVREGDTETIEELYRIVSTYF